MMGMMRGMGGPGLRQGAPLDLLEFVVTRDVQEPRPVPTGLLPLPRLARADAQRERVFRFDSRMMRHTINGRPFAMERVDERVPFGATEVWRFVNDAPFPHPVHMHAVHFQVLARTGGRGGVFPWERGWKDTVLVFPGETVDVITRFDSHQGLFLLHCHNLEHEDMGMMMNFLIE
jgi:FtsP/CotA-like multicopper oxidase with cupredoxin domain